MVSTIIPVQPFDLVVFGATGDLSRRKILPAMFRRVLAGQCPKGSRIIGASRSAYSDSEFQDVVRTALIEFVPKEEYNKETLEEFIKIISYKSVDAYKDNGWAELENDLNQSDNEIRTYYLSISPTLIEATTQKIREFNMVTDETRVVVEKPLGTDLASAKKLNTVLRDTFKERQIYRIDHYLGKETVQNLMALRFANTFLEPLWNNKYVDHVQITVAETVTVGGRGEYYNLSGAMRDMVQNHMMQLLCLVAMEPPSHFDADAVRDEKLKVIRSLAPVDINQTVRGQYEADQGDDGFLDHVGDQTSTTESFVALKAEVANWRWAGVPFYMRTGKAMKKRASEIAVVFKPVPHSIFDNQFDDFQNRLVIRLQPEEGVKLHMSVKEPGPGGMRLTEVPLDMSFEDAVPDSITIDAYERLILDAVRGNQTLFMRGDEVEAAWEWVDNIIAGWDDAGTKPKPYPQGSTGPEDAIALMALDKRRWLALREQ